MRDVVVELYKLAKSRIWGSFGGVLSDVRGELAAWLLGWETQRDRFGQHQIEIYGQLEVKLPGVFLCYFLLCQGILRLPINLYRSFHIF